VTVPSSDPADAGVPERPAGGGERWDGYGPVDDPGLAAQRSVLAWQRTALSLAVAGTVQLRLEHEWADPLPVLSGVVLIVSGVAAYRYARWRARRVATVRGPAPVVLRMLSGLLLLSVLLTGAGLAGGR
jgi:uncharacterized membrane protein YidH (DUF202 family)